MKNFSSPPLIFSPSRVSSEENEFGIFIYLSCSSFPCAIHKPIRCCFYVDAMEKIAKSIKQMKSVVSMEKRETEMISLEMKNYGNDKKECEKVGLLEVLILEAAASVNNFPSLSHCQPHSSKLDPFNMGNRLLLICLQMKFISYLSCHKHD